jgi:urease alpha subunit
MFVSQCSKEKVEREYGLKKTIEAVKHCRTMPKPDDVPLSKKHMKYNSEMPKMEVDPETFVSPAFSLLPPAHLSNEAWFCRQSKPTAKCAT